MNSIDSSSSSGLGHDYYPVIRDPLHDIDKATNKFKSLATGVKGICFAIIIF